MSSILQDVRYGARLLAKAPGFAAIAVVTLALGVGLTTTMFSIVYGALLRGLPFEEAERIVHLERSNLSQGIEDMGMPIHDFVDWRKRQRVFEDIAAYYSGTVNVSGTERPERFQGAFVTANLFDVLGVRPALGRSFRHEEDQPGAAGAIILSHSVWLNRYNADPEILGRVVRANGKAATVVGIMPPGFQFPLTQQVWLPLQLDPVALPRGEGQWLDVIGRLRGGVSLDQANAAMNAVARQIALEHPETNEGVGAIVHSFIDEYIGDEPTALLYTMLGAVFLVLLIACSNVANLLLSRAALRSKEVGIRSAMGAARWRVVIQFLTEAALLSLIGAVLGLGIAFAGIRIFNAAIVDAQPPYWIDIRLDLPALLFVLAVIALSALLSGIMPALQASHTDVNAVLKDESRGSSSFRMGRVSKGLVMLEVALSCGLLVAAGLTIKSITKLRNIDFAFPTEDVFTARVGLMESDYPDHAARVRFFDALLDRLQQLPGSTGAALVSALPGTYAGGPAFAIEGAVYPTERDYPWTRRVIVTPSFFRTFGVGLLEGRELSVQDREGDLPVAIVNVAFAERFFPGKGALSRRIRLGGEDSEEPWRTIVGIAPDMHAGGIENEAPQAVYVPLAQSSASFMSIVVRTTGDPLALTPAVREAVTAIDPGLPIYWARSLAQAIAEIGWFYRIFGVMFMIFGFVALFLAAIGLYGVMAFSVSRRSREMGVRMALGAQAGDVLRLILRQGLFQLAVGILIGLGLAATLSQLLTTILFEVNPRDPAVFVGIVLTLVATGLLACIVPARRAMRVDPMVALHYE